MQVLPPMIISPYTKEITMYAVFYYSLELFITLGHFSKKVERMENIHWKKESEYIHVLVRNFIFLTYGFLLNMF